MYRLFLYLLGAVAILIGLLVGTLNPQAVEFKLLWLQLDWPLGLVIMSAFVTGLALGLLLLWTFSVMPLRLRLKRAAKAAESSPVTHE